MKLIAFTVKGLENIAEAEILEAFPKARIISKESKAIIFDPKTESFDKLTDFKTIDDVGLFVYEIENTKNLNHKSLSELICAINFAPFRRKLSLFRSIKAKKFSLTVSLPGYKTLKTVPFKNRLASDLAEANDWVYTEMNHENCDIRIFKGDSSIYVAIRVTPLSLHEREYKKNFKRGSLRPTIAAAMVRLATKGQSGKVVDNFCGSGTILAEAFIAGNSISGGDIDKGSVYITQQNLKELDFDEEDAIKELDATKTNWPADSFDYAISNLPWDKQIAVESFTDLFIESLEEYKRILKKDNYRIVLLVKKPELMEALIKRVFGTVSIDTIEISMMGQQPVIFIVEPFDR